MSEVANETGRPSDLFEEAERTRIAQLALGQPDSETSTYIEAVVSLIWPYSSQIGAFSLLLAEPDVRLRNAKGQLKVTFHGHGAREVAKSQVGIGDTVRLRLAYAEWTNTGEAVSTPGKKVEWDLHFKNRLVLEVRRNGKKLATIDYERGNTPPPTPEASPSPSGKLLVRNQSDRGTIAFGTPVSVTTKRISSGSFIDASLDPFADDDGFVLGKGRKRTKFGRTSGAWKLVDDEADGVEAKQHSPEVIVIDDSSTPETNPVESSMPPPLTLFGIAPSKTGNVVPEAEEDIVDSLRKLPRQPREDSPETEKNTVTPRIHPLTSPGLPLVSPLVKNVGASIGYFGPQPLESSQLDAISLTPTSPREVTVSSEVELDEMGRREEAESFVQATEIAPVPEPELLLVDDDNGAPSDIFATNLEKQTTGFGNVAVESPFGLPSSGFAGFSSESNALTSTSFNTTKTPLAVPPTLFGIPPNPALFSFQPSAGLGQSTASGFGAFSGSSRELPFDQPRRTPDRQDFGLKTSRERDDEDMYGPEHAMHVINDEEDIGTPAASQTKHREPEPLSVADDGTGEEYSNNLGELRTHDTTMGTIREQLLTPDNTQQDPAQELSQAAFQQVTSLQMPPTPDNTQEPAYAAMLNFDGTSDLRPVQQLEEQIAVVRSAETEQTIEIRDIDTIFNVKAVSSPYFNARESPRLPPERQVEATDKPKSQEVVHKHMREEHAMTEHDEVEAPSPPTLKSRLSTLGMITPLSYYTPLPNLPEHFSQLVDVLAVCTDNTGQPTRSKAGPKDYKITLHLTDMYLERPSTITAQVFRPFESALPSVRRGDVVLLRAFKVQSQKHRMVLLSTDSSAWAVFSSPDAPARTIEPYGLHVATPGPPVEYGLEEYVYAKRLMEWWDKTGAAEHPLLPPTPGDDATAEPETRPASRRFPTPPQSRAKAGLAGDAAPTVTNGNTDADKSESTKPNPARTTRSSRRTNITTNDMNNEQDTRDQFAPLSPIHKPTSPKVSRRTMNKTGNEANADYPSSQADPTSPIRATRSSRRVANRTDHVANSEEPDATDTIEPLPEMPSPKVGRRTRRSTSVISATPEPTRSLRSHSTVHELRDGTKYADGRVPTKKDGVHELRDGTKYVDENVSPVGMAVNEREERVVHELQDGTNYVDRMRSKSPEVRRSARNTGRRGGSLVHELRDGARYTDG